MMYRYDDIISAHGFICELGYYGIGGLSFDGVPGYAQGDLTRLYANGTEVLRADIDFTRIMNNGLGLPNLDTSQRDALLNIPLGTAIYNIDSQQLEIYNGPIPGWSGVGVVSPGGSDTQIQINQAGTFGASTALSTSADYQRLLLSGAVDDGTSALQLNGTQTFQSGVIAELTASAQTTVSYTGQIIMGTGPTGPVTVHFVGGANDGISIAATGYTSTNPYCTVYYLVSAPPSIPAINDTYRLSLIIHSPLYAVGQDLAGNWYYPYLATSKPASWSDGPVNAIYESNPVSAYFQEFTGSIFTVFVEVVRSTSANPFTNPATISAAAATSIDPINRWLIANDGVTTNLDWSNPLRLLVAGATDDTVSALQIAGAININNGNQFINADGSIGGGASNTAGVTAFAIGNGVRASAGFAMVFGGYAAYASGLASLAMGVCAQTDHDWSTVIGNAANGAQLNDSNAPGGLTLGGQNNNIGGGENWLGILPGTAANTPRLLFPLVTTVDDVTSSLQVNGRVSIGNGKLFLNTDGSVGYSASAANPGQDIAFGQAFASGNPSVSMGYGTNASGYASVALGVEAVAANPWSTVIGPGNDSLNPSGFTVNGNNVNTSANEHWLYIVPGLTSNKGRMLFPAGSVTDDTTSTLQINGAINIANGTQMINADGSIGVGASATIGAVSFGTGTSATMSDDSAFGYQSSAHGGASSALGLQTDAGGYASSAIGTEAHTTAAWSTVVGPGNDSNALGGFTLAGQGPLGHENWLMVLPGTITNAPRVIVGATTIDDGSSALQVYGGIRLADFTTITTPVEGQLAYNYATHVTTYYNGVSWV